MNNETEQANAIEGFRADEVTRKYAEISEKLDLLELPHEQEMLKLSTEKMVSYPIEAHQLRGNPGFKGDVGLVQRQYVMLETGLNERMAGYMTNIGMENVMSFEAEGPFFVLEDGFEPNSKAYPAALAFEEWLIQKAEVLFTQAIEFGKNLSPKYDGEILRNPGNYVRRILLQEYLAPMSLQEPNSSALNVFIRNLFDDYNNAPRKNMDPLFERMNQFIEMGVVKPVATWAELLLFSQASLKIVEHPSDSAEAAATYNADTATIELEHPESIDPRSPLLLFIQFEPLLLSIGLAAATVFIKEKLNLPDTIDAGLYVSNMLFLLKNTKTMTDRAKRIAQARNMLLSHEVGHSFFTHVPDLDTANAIRELYGKNMPVLKQGLLRYYD